jgi:aminopeptidase
MLTDIQLDKYSDVMLWALKTARKERFKKNDAVLIRFDPSAATMAEMIQGKVLDLGMNPVLRPGLTPGMERCFYERANQKQLVFVSPGEKELFENIHGSIFLHAPDSLTHLRGVDSKKIGKALVAKKFLRDILDEREDSGKFAWTLCTLPTEELSKQAGLTLRRYTNQIIKACYLDEIDPVLAWRRVYKDALAIKKWLNSMDVMYLRIQSENMDLKITPGKKRKWVGLSGHNIPSFEIFLSPDWRGTEGSYYADQPSFRSGNHVKGVRLTFRKGVVSQIQAEQGKAFLAEQVSMDGGASRVGEFSLTDRRFSRINHFMANTLYDENFGGPHGNCHLALGSSYTDTYAGDPSELSKQMKARLGFNESALHWDLVNTEKKKVTARLVSGSDLVIYENGLFNLSLIRP